MGGPSEAGSTVFFSSICQLRLHSLIPYLAWLLHECGLCPGRLIRVRIRRFLGLQKVSRAAHSHRASVEHMGVDHGGVYISVPHQLLDRADVLSTLQQMGSEGVTEGMRRGGLMDSARQHGSARGAAPCQPYSRLAGGYFLASA